jgi:hypothetical protein
MGVGLLVAVLVIIGLLFLLARAKLKQWKLSKDYAHLEDTANAEKQRLLRGYEEGNAEFDRQLAQRTQPGVGKKLLAENIN